MNSTEELLLASVLADRDRLAAQSPIWERGEDRHLFARRRVAIEDARCGRIALNWRTWLGRTLTPADHQCGSRAVRSLVARGLIEAFGDQRIKAVALTSSGEALAKELATTERKPK